MIKPHNFYLAALMALLLSCQPDTSQERNEIGKPNVLFIVVDDLNDWVGFMEGHPQTYTPNIDRLAASGMAFVNAHTNSPLCGPSRSSLLTGLRPSSTGVYFHIDDADLASYRQQALPDVRFLPDQFEQHGYSTFGVGKIYHGGDKAGTFEEYGGLSNFGPKPEERFEYDPAWFGKPGGTSTDWGEFPAHDSLTFDHRIADWAIGKLVEKHEKPFLLTVGFMRPHVPWYVPQHWFNNPERDTIFTPPYRPDDWQDVPEMAAKITDLPMMPEMEWVLEEGKWGDMVDAYLACVTFVDHQVGRVLDALEKSPYADNTLIVFTSDHGYHLGEKGLFQKSTLWQRSTHVPLLFAGLGIKSGISEEPASLLDIYPTILDGCGLEANPALEGQSLFPIIQGQTSTIDNYAVTTYGYQNHSIRKGKWHYIRYNDGSEELYDLATDPNEWENLAGNADFTSIKSQMAGLLPEKNVPNIPASHYGSTPFFAEGGK